jgi:phosphohistidine phosphatase
VKRLAILRHAKSSWNDPALKDHDRPLNKRGWRAARRMGAEMRNRGMHFDYVLASTAIRVRETLEGVRENFPIDSEIHFEPGVYNASEEMLLALVRGLPESAETPLLIGHNSGIERLIVELTKEDRDGLRSRVARKFPTGALAVIGLSADRWVEVGLGSGEITKLICPCDLD